MDEMRIPLLLALALALSCTGMRPALDRAGPDLARTPEERAAMQYLGDGCYVADRTVFACSIDALPAGELACAVEPPETGHVVEMTRVRYRGGAYEEYYDRDLDAFVDELNTHRCHERLYDTFEIEGPVPLAIRDARAPTSTRFVPLAELGLTAFPRALEVPRDTARKLCTYSPTRTSEHWVFPICVAPDGGVEIPRDLLSRGWTDVPASTCSSYPCWFAIDLDAVLERDVRGAPSDTMRCGLAEATASPFACRSVIARTDR
jgi:hypothetical protein